MFTYQHYKHYEFSFSQEKANKIAVILYAQIGTKDFDKFHKKIIELATKLSNKYSIDYILRHNYLASSNTDSNSNKIGLSGYGVELDIKSTEYKAKDDSKVNSQGETTKWTN